MNREEAIRVLEDNRPTVIFEDENAQKRMAELCHAGDGSPDGRLLEALDMAIEALKTEPIRCGECENYIDRRCIEANHHVAAHGNCMGVFGASIAYTPTDAYGDYDDPQPYEEAIDMAIEALQFVEHFDLLKEYQSLQEVVKCKDCRHRDLFSCPLADNDFQKDDDYCSWGERREK